MTFQTSSDGEAMKTICRCVAVAVLLVLTSGPAAYAQGTWTTTLAPVMPLPVEGAQGSGSGNINVALYGFTSPSETNLTRRYNISKDMWTLSTTLAPDPPRAEIAYGDNQHGGFVYVIGGRPLFGGPPINNNDRYDPATDTWQSLALMPTARAAAASAVLDNSIYVIGGRIDTNGPCAGLEVNTVERYDVDTNTWSTSAPPGTLAPYPAPRSDMAARAFGGKIYVFGGCTNGTPTGEANVYDPKKNTWTAIVPPMPTARAGLVAGIVGQKIYAIGGVKIGSMGFEALKVNEAYNVTTNSWSTAAEMPTARSEAAVRSHGGRIYVYGGGGFGVATNANEVFKP